MPQQKTHQANTSTDLSRSLLETIWQTAKGAATETNRVSFNGQGSLPSFFCVTELAAAAMGAAGLATATLVDALNASGGQHHPEPPSVQVDRRLASFWFASTIRPQGWVPPTLTEVGAADYLAKDGWLRLHTNAAHHLEVALNVLKCAATPEAMAQAVSTWEREALEERILAAGGCAATMRSAQEWNHHPQGQAILREPLLAWADGEHGTAGPWAFEQAQPLKGLKVLDMTRVLAGPAATRMLAGLGAQVLRIDAPMWNESNAPEMTLGKHCAELDLRQADQRAQWVKLLSQADVLVHGYRSDALASLGLDAHARQRIRPGLVDISLDAYGFTGPWAHRRGFDSLVQMSIGIAHAGQQLSESVRPRPLPVQALDHATGYLLATAALRGLEHRVKTGMGSIARASLARTGSLLMTTLDPAGLSRPLLAPETSEDLSVATEHTYWGPAKRVKWPVNIAGVEMKWSLGAGPLKRDAAHWL